MIIEILMAMPCTQHKREDERNLPKPKLILIINSLSLCLMYILLLSVICYSEILSKLLTEFLELS